MVRKRHRLNRVMRIYSTAFLRLPELILKEARPDGISSLQSLLDGHCFHSLLLLLNFFSHFFLFRQNKGGAFNLCSFMLIICISN